MPSRSSRSRKKRHQAGHTLQGSSRGFGEIPIVGMGASAGGFESFLMDALARQRQTCTVQVFSSDIDEQGLQFARRGIYPESIVADVPEEFRERYFTKLDSDHYQVTKPVREAVVFARQNVIADPPFSRLDLISCRNLMIYLEPGAQERVSRLFHFALKDQGYVFVGSSETVGRCGDLFEPLSKKWHVFRKVPTPYRLSGLELAVNMHRGAKNGGDDKEATELPLDLGGLTEEALLREYAPASVIVNRRLEVLFFYGHTARYLRHPTGKPTQDLIALTPDAIHTKLRSSIYRVFEEGEPVVVKGVRLPRDGGHQRIRISVRPLKKLRERGLLLVSFEDEPEVTPAVAHLASEGDDDRVRYLEAELKSTREDLSPVAREVWSEEGECYLRRILPNA